MSHAAPDPAAEDVAGAKSALRAQLRRVRREIAADAAERQTRSDRIGAALADALAGRPLQRVMLFESLPTEPDTTGWIAGFAEGGVEVFLPEVDGPHLRAQPGDVDPATLDVVVVPGLGFTHDGRRLGQGGGHYDRFLARLAATCLTVGVCFGEQLVDDLPTGPYDRAVDVVLTDA